MPLTDEERQQLDALLGTTPPSAQAPPLPGTIPPTIPVGQPYPISAQIGKLRLTIPPPAAEMQRQAVLAESKQRSEESSETRRQLLKKAADQKLQLEQAIGLFTKIYNEAEQNVPVIAHPEGTLPLQQAGRFVGQKLGLREKQRGTITSLQARATPALKSLGEVGVLTNQDIARMLKGGFPSDDDTAISRQMKREGIISDLQAKLNQVNTVLGTSGTRQTDTTDPYLAEARRRGLIP